MRNIYDKEKGVGRDGSAQEESIIFALAHYLSLSVHRQVWASPGCNPEVSLLTTWANSL